MPESPTRAETAALRLQAAAEEMLSEVQPLPADLVTWKPAADVWSVMEILCHVQEFVPYWTRQIAQIVEHPDQTWGRDHTNTDRLDAVGKAAERTLADVQQAIRTKARESAERIGRLSDADLAIEATSKNPRWGLKPAHFILDELIVQHVEKHIGQIRRNVSQYHALFSAPPPVFAPIHGRAEQLAIRRIFCVGRNYEAHAKEMGVAVDRDAPFYFTKFAESYVPSGATVAYPPGTSNYHYEVELVVAIGKPAFRIAEADALSYVFGYACGLDMTRRDLQLAEREKKRPWDLGKNFEQSAVLGEIQPAQDIGHPSHGGIELRVNGQTKQSADLSQLIHGVPAVVSHLSHYYHLRPGDLIYTGTPEGIGPVVAGDRIEGSIAGVGTVALQLGPPE